MRVYPNRFKAKFVALIFMLTVGTQMKDNHPKRRDMSSDQKPESPYDELTRLVQEGKTPEDIAARAQLVADKFLGNVPLGIDAPRLNSRKMIGGAASLFDLLRNGFFGLVCTLLGTGFVWAGFHGQLDRMTFIVGAVMLAIGVFMLWRSVRAWRSMRAISRA